MTTDTGEPTPEISNYTTRSLQVKSVGSGGTWFQLFLVELELTEPDDQGGGEPLFPIVERDRELKLTGFARGLVELVELVNLRDREWTFRFEGATGWVEFSGVVSRRVELTEVDEPERTFDFMVGLAIDVRRVRSV